MPDFTDERDALVPKKGYLHIEETEDHPDGIDLKLPRLTMRRTLRLSQLLDSVTEDPKVQPLLTNVVNVLTTAGDSPGFAQVGTINKLLAALNPQDVNELFEIVTGMPPDWLDRNLEPGWAFQAIKVAFQQQGFSKLFTAAADAENTAGDNPLPATPQSNNTQEVSAPVSISYSQPTAGTTIPS